MTETAAYLPSNGSKTDAELASSRSDDGLAKSDEKGGGRPAEEDSDAGY